MDVADFLPMNMSAATEPVVKWADISLFEPDAVRVPQQATTSQFVQINNREFELFLNDATQAVTAGDVDGKYGLRSLQAPRIERQVPAKTMSTVEKVSAERIKLLSVKYARGPGQKEVLARLSTLNERMLEASPRVTIEQVGVLEQVDAGLATLRARREERSRRLGL